MLMDLRDRIQGWIAFGIIGLVSIPFVLWGVGEYFTGAKNPPVAEVDGIPITQQALEQAVSQQRQAIIQRLGGQATAELLQSLHLDQAVLNQMIDERVLSLFVQKAGFKAPDAVVADLIRSEAAFQSNGAFDPKKYEQFVAAQGTTVPVFEARLKHDIVMQTLENAIRESSIVPAPQLDELVRLRDQTRQVGLITLNRAQIAARVPAPTEAQIQAYYDAHKADYVQPDRVKVNYIELSPQTLAPQVRVDEQEIQDAYAAYEKKQQASVIRTVRHILLQVPKDADAATVEQIKEKLLAAREKIVSGKISFADEAKAISEDPGSKAQGGDLGEVAPGEMVKPFEAAMDALKVGEISEPVRTSFGWHLIEVTKESHPVIQPLDAMRDTLTAEVRAKHIDKIYYDLTEKLSDQAYQHPDSLIPAAEALGLKVETSDWITQSGGTGIGADEKVRQAAFSNAVLKQQQNSSVIELGNNHALVLRVHEHEASKQLTLAEVMDKVRTAATEAAVMAEQRRVAAAIEAELGAGKPADAVAAAQAATWRPPEWIKRNQSQDGLPPEAQKAAFAVPAAAPGKVATRAVTLADGNEAVVVVQAVKPGDPSAISAEDKQALAAEIQQASAQRSLAALMATLRAEAKVTIHTETEKSLKP
ncbi:SurA N-terminal domain-containing protein [Halothiobacillus sp. DCM-1]|uniref:SurA N-terminal domain-containing protein n=1 Tax=Halothiobacillus sp. DCM-1 TaxID=3112558 RepID=UPI00324F66A3